MGSYASILVALILAVAIPTAFLVLSAKLGPRRPHAAKATPYESGILQKRPSRDRIPIRFYLVAVLFLIFDVEAVFLFPWAIARRDLGAAGDIGMGIFFAILVLGLAYEWRKGAMEWE